MVLLLLNSFGFCMSENVFNLLLSSKAIFPGYGILGCQVFFSLGTLKMWLPCLSGYIVSTEKIAVFLNFVLLYGKPLFFFFFPSGNWKFFSITDFEQFVYDVP